MNRISRRKFIKAASAIGGFSILPSGLWANPPSSRLTYALVGCGNNGKGTTKRMMSHPKLQVIGLCDPDKRALAAAQSELGVQDVNMYSDSRVMLDALGDTLDCIEVSTPDHNHHAVTLQAMRLGKHVYTQKPLTHKISEARELKKAAQETGVVTRMGIQLHSSLGNRMVIHFLRNGSIGKIKKVYVWSDKKWGMDRDERNPAIPVPDGLAWDLWLGNAPTQPYRNGIHPARWRCFLDFGAGTLGDMGVHIFDTPFKALELSSPKWVKATCRKPNGFSFPAGSTVEYSFPETKYTTRNFRWTWFDGPHCATKRIPELQLPEGKKLPSQGAVYVGEKGCMIHPHTSGPTFVPNSIRSTLTKPDLKPMNHYHDWIDACLANQRSTHADFAYSSLLTETVLLGTIGSYYPGIQLEWDHDHMTFPHMPEANALI